MLGRGRWRITFWADAAHYHQSGDPFYDYTQQLESCTIEFREGATFNRIGSPVAATPEACHWNSSNTTSYPGGGTITPNRVPSRADSQTAGAAGTAKKSVRLPLLRATPTGLKRVR